MCHARRHTRPISAADTDAGRPASPAPAPPDPRLRASDADREALVAQLREHGAAGRLDVEELEQRVAAAYAARTHGELAQLVTDLPAAATTAPTPAARSHRRRDAHGDWRVFVQVNLLLVAIWAVTGAGAFWPGWVAAWWALALVLKTAPRLLRLP